MTTIVRTRIPLETLRMSSNQPTGRRRSKRLAAYDEEDGDFVFTRASKRTKTVPPPPEPVLTPAPAPPAKRGRKPKTPKETNERDNEPATTAKKPKGRKMSFSTPKADEDTLVVPKKRKTTRSSVGKTTEATTNGNASRLDPTNHDAIEMVNGATHDGAENRNIDPTKHSTVIALPFSDTPIINRNKELRKKGGNGTRRSSLGLRGRRASSLIDNGHSAIPHREVETSEFYKHIEAEGLSEPRRMKQLLTWTGERCMGQKPAHGDADNGAELAARMIKETLLKDFANKSEFSDWFSREESVPPAKVIKKPNPRNVELEENLVGLEARIKLLREERDQWKAIANPPPSLPPLFPDETADLEPSRIDASLLDPEQVAILAEITSSSAFDMRKQVSDRLQSLQSGLELKVDQFSDGVHKIEQYQEIVGKASDKILALSAVRLAERDTKEKEEIGTRDLPMQEVLRSLSRILPEGRNSR